MWTKICNNCNIEKDIYDFTIISKRPSVSKICKCCIEKNKHIQKEKDKIKNKLKKWICEEKKKEQIKKDKIRQYRNNRKEKAKEYNKTYRKNKYATDPLFKIKICYRNITCQSFKKKGYKKNSISEQLLGCSYEDFKIYLESKFEHWMSYDNYGLYDKDKYDYGWDIDHICPLSNASSEDELIKLCHYTNLQPLCSKINRDVKRDILQS
jgi:hypothetical protein